MANKKFKVLFKKIKLKILRKKYYSWKLMFVRHLFICFFTMRLKKNIIWNHSKSCLGENFYIILNFKLNN